VRLHNLSAATVWDSKIGYLSDRFNEGFRSTRALNLTLQRALQRIENSIEILNENNELIQRKYEHYVSTWIAQS